MYTMCGCRARFFRGRKRNARVEKERERETGERRLGQSERRCCRETGENCETMDGRNTLTGREQRENLGSAIVVGMERGLFTFPNDQLASSRRGRDPPTLRESLPMWNFARRSFYDFTFVYRIVFSSDLDWVIHRELLPNRRCNFEHACLSNELKTRLRRSPHIFTLSLSLIASH